MKPSKISPVYQPLIDISIAFFAGWGMCAITGYLILGTHQTTVECRIIAPFKNPPGVTVELIGKGKVESI